MTTPSPKLIVRSYLALSGLYTLAASLIWGVNTLFLLDAGLGIGQVFIVNAIFTGAMALFEIPTGVLADTSGRRISFLLSIAILLVGTMGYVVVFQSNGNIWWFALASVILGLGYTFYSGAMEAWLVDALGATNYTGTLDEIFARGAIISSGAMLIGSIGGGLLATWNLALPYVARSLLLIVVFVVAFLAMHDIGFTRQSATLRQLPAEMKKIAGNSVKYGWNQRSIRLLMMASFVQATFMAWGFYAWQPYFLELLGRNAPWVAGVISALVALSMMAGNYVVERMSHRGGRRTTLMMVSAVVQTVAAVGVGLATSFWVAVPLYLLAIAMTGIWEPVKQAYLHQIIPSEQRATVVSFDSLVASSGSMLGQGTLGQIAARQSISAAYIVGGLTTGLVWPIVLRLRRRDDEADTIIGDAGQESACGAQGLPNVSCLDSKAGAAVTSAA